ncbi:MAG: lamin tail domain-containing protein [bacterium]
MKKLAITLLVLALSAGAVYAANPVRISQIYGAGGNSGSIWNADYVELFNDSSADVDMSGWSLQYGSATGTTPMGSCTNCLVVFPAGTVIRSCQYFLVRGSTGTAGAPLPVTPDLLSSVAMSATAGKIGVKADTLFTPVVPCNPALFVDMVGYGTTANCFEGTGAAPAPSTTLADWRGVDGITDTDNNSFDFTTAAPLPRNSTSPANPNCHPVAVDPSSWGQVKATYR